MHFTSPSPGVPLDAPGAAFFLSFASTGCLTPPREAAVELQINCIRLYLSLSLRLEFLFVNLECQASPVCIKYSMCDLFTLAIVREAQNCDARQIG